MEDIIKALLDVVRAQHSATEGSEEKPFDIDDIIDMALNIAGRPEEEEEQQEMIRSIQEMAQTLAPDIFPPKTFEEMDDSERAASAVNMIEERLRQGGVTGNAGQSEQKMPDPVPYQQTTQQEEEEDSGFGFDVDPQENANLNDLIYNNFMQMMGLNDPKVEYPFDRSQIRYGREKTATEMLEEEAAAKKAQEEEETRRKARPVSAWELAQAAVNKDEEEHHKEEPEAKRMEMPETKSASQLAAEAIARAREEDQMKMEAEKRAERLMEEARKRGKDPMEFALHRQEILDYMEKNSDELVSFEDYDDLSPEEKFEIEQRMYRDKQLEAGVAPEDIQEKMPEDLPLQNETVPADVQEVSSENNVQPEQPVSAPVFSEEMLRQISREVVQENEDMIFAEDANADLGAINETIYENLKELMRQGNGVVKQEDVESLIGEVIARNTSSPASEEKAGDAEPVKEPEHPQPQTRMEEVSHLSENGRPMSAVELAKAAQKAAKPDPAETKEGKSAVELAMEAQESARQQKSPAKEPEEEILNEDDLNFDDLDPEEEKEPAVTEEKQEEPGEEIKEDTSREMEEEPAPESMDRVQAEHREVREEEKEDEIEYVDPGEMVLGEHTQAEIDEAMENLASLGLEGDVYERAKRMLLLELAGSEAVLDAWLAEQEGGRKKKAAVSALDTEDSLDDLGDLNEDDLEKELELAMDEDFLEEESEMTGEELSEEPEREESEDEREETQRSEEEEAPEESEPEEEDETKESIQIEKTILHRSSADRERASRKKNRKNMVKRKEKSVHEKKDAAGSAVALTRGPVEEKEFQVSVPHPFVLKNSASFMDKFEEYIVDTQENRKLSTGFKRLDAMLRYGLHKGSYFVDSAPQYLKNGFMQQIADRAAESGVDVLYISTELSRFDLMVDTISRLSYEMNKKDEEKAVSPMAIMTGEEGADIQSLKDELNWYRGRISEHLFVLDQEAVSEYVESMEEASAGDILEELIRSIVKEGAHKPVVFIDNIENILSADDSEDMKPLMDGIRKLAKELGIPIIMSYGYAQSESEEELYPEEIKFHRSLGNMCDVYLELQYADMITEDYEELSQEDIQDMMEDGEMLLVNILLHKNRRTMKASCQIQAAPKFNYYEE
ncbi:MAG: DnaB helicase C-terminal domain-containing protein [Eubacterium sp.]|nr:DnaB helicase C-terminal domain-containing protein [Eubacterium sp.]